MNDSLKVAILDLNFSKYLDQGGRLLKSAPPNIKTLKKVQDFVQVHGWDTYDYTSFKYLGARIKSTIKCPKHGVFEQTPGDHVKGQGCPKCRNSLGDTSILYLLKSTTTDTYKIGITNNLDRRIASIGDSLIRIASITISNPGTYERLLHKKYQKIQRFNPNVRNGGTEFFQLSEEQVQEVLDYFKSIS